VLQWTLGAVAKAGTIGVIGAYSLMSSGFPIRISQQKNLTVQGGNANHRSYISSLLDHVASGTVDPTMFAPPTGFAMGAIEAYESFDRREGGWLKVELDPAS